MQHLFVNTHPMPQSSPCDGTAAYTACAERTRCPCSRGATGHATEVTSIKALVKSRSASAITMWPADAHGKESSAARQLLWLRKVVGVRIASNADYPSCFKRASTLAGPCEIRPSNVRQPAPHNSHNKWRNLTVTTRRATFWMAFAWHTQYAHWLLEHLPRMWYYLQLCQLLPQPPLLLVPPGLASWQIHVLRALPTAVTPRLREATLVTLHAPQYFSTLYVPGMLSHIGIMWTPQAMQLWQLLPQLAWRQRQASSAAFATSDAASHLFSFRPAGSRTAGGARLLADRFALADGLRSLGFKPLTLETLSLRGKLEALRGAKTLIVECGSALANAMLLPRGLTLIVLCMQQHTSSEGCYTQLLASQFTGAPVHTLRIGMPLQPAASVSDENRGNWNLGPGKNSRNNVQSHVAWTLSVPHTLEAIATLANVQSADRQVTHGPLGWPKVPKSCDRGTSAVHGKLGRRLSTATRSTLAVDAQWWRRPERLLRGGDEVRSRVFSLIPGCGASNTAAPRCFELRTKIARKAKANRNEDRQQPHAVEWRPCQLTTHCTKWRWCIHKDGARHNNLTADRNTDCEEHMQSD